MIVNCCLYCTVFKTTEVPQLISLTVADLGNNVTFGCEVSEKELKSLHWYKQPLGHLPQSVASVILDKITLTDAFKDSRFTLNKDIFTIRNVSKEDEATYFCQKGTTYSQMFSSGTFLAVKGNISVILTQIKSVVLGDSVTLECSLLSKNKEKALQCPDDHSVYWFRAGSEKFTPNIIYTLVNNSDEALKRRCVYSLTKTIQNSSDVGTYYCAVVTCGEILLGEGTKVETRIDSLSLLKKMAFLTPCSNQHSSLQELYVSRYQSSSRAFKSFLIFSRFFHYSSVRVNRGNRKRRDSTQDCVKAAVRQDSHTQRQPSA
ncbi:regulator of G-protein signaling [Sarotherodon galilaeus]